MVALGEGFASGCKMSGPKLVCDVVCALTILYVFVFVSLHFFLHRVVVVVAVVCGRHATKYSLAVVRRAAPR